MGQNPIRSRSIISSEPKLATMRNLFAPRQRFGDAQQPGASPRSPATHANSSIEGAPQYLEIEVNEDRVQVRVRHNARARSLRLSLPAAKGPVLTVPQGVELGEAERFLSRHADWLSRHMTNRPGPRPFAPDMLVPLRGETHRLVADARMRGQVEIEATHDVGLIHVPGGEAHLARRFTTWLKAQAHGDLDVRVAYHAQNLDVRPKGLSIRGQSTRWGSCSGRGRLSFNWRLVLAPPFVLDYVAAHEVAHLREMNHSAAFWATVTRTLPEMDRGRDWLRAHGAELLGYGATH